MTFLPEANCIQVKLKNRIKRKGGKRHWIDKCKKTIFQPISSSAVITITIIIMIIEVIVVCK